MPTHYPGSDSERRALDVYIKLLRAAESVHARTLSSASEAGLTPTQFGVLEALHHLGPMMLSELAAKHLKSPNNLTVVTDNLEKRGLVRRERSARDRRVVEVFLTDSGRAQVEAILPRHVAAVVRDFAVLTADEQERLGALLKRLGRQLPPENDGCPPPPSRRK
jgi:MarR family 2-MHQ and catechol resistance regulon transcriptional repressor